MKKNTPTNLVSTTTPKRRSSPGANHRMVRQLASALRRHCNIQPNQRLLLAVSGGSDSVALLRALVLLAPRRRWHLQLTVAHIQHHLRPDAERDARFVQQLAQQFNLPFCRDDITIPDNQNTEAAARRLRYRSLTHIAHDRKIPNIATAHTADDQLETLLMRLVRGAGVRGLAGIGWKRNLPPRPNHAAHTPPIQLIRPMLGVDRPTVHDFLNQIEQTWREDSTNTDTSRWRARLRRDVLPVLRQLRPDVAQKALATGAHMRETAAAIDAAIAQSRKNLVTVLTDRTVTVNRPAARALPRAILAGLLRQLLIDTGVRADRLGRKTLTPLLRATRDHHGGERRFEFGQDVCAQLTREHITLHHPPRTPHEQSD